MMAPIFNGCNVRCLITKNKNTIISEYDKTEHHLVSIIRSLHDELMKVQHQRDNLAGMLQECKEELESYKDVVAKFVSELDVISNIIPEQVSK